MNELIRAIQKAFPGKNMGVCIFFETRADGSIDKMNPLFKEPKDIQNMVKTLKECSDACNYLANDMVKKSLPKN